MADTQSQDRRKMPDDGDAQEVRHRLDGPMNVLDSPSQRSQLTVSRDDVEEHREVPQQGPD